MPINAFGKFIFHNSLVRSSFYSFFLNSNFLFKFINSVSHRKFVCIKEETLNEYWVKKILDICFTKSRGQK